jgi:hypothetical protein
MTRNGTSHSAGERSSAHEASGCNSRSSMVHEHALFNRVMAPEQNKTVGHALTSSGSVPDRAIDAPGTAGRKPSVAHANAPESSSKPTEKSGDKREQQGQSQTMASARRECATPVHQPAPSTKPVEGHTTRNPSLPEGTPENSKPPIHQNSPACPPVEHPCPPKTKKPSLPANGSLESHKSPTQHNPESPPVENPCPPKPKQPQQSNGDVPIKNPGTPSQKPAGNQPVEHPTPIAPTQSESPPSLQPKPTTKPTLEQKASQITNQPSEAIASPSDKSKPASKPPNVSSIVNSPLDVHMRSSELLIPPLEPLEPFVPIPSNDTFSPPAPPVESYLAPPMVPDAPVPTDVFGGLGPNPLDYGKKYEELYHVPATPQQESFSAPTIGLVNVPVELVGLGRDAGMRNHQTEVVPPADKTRLGQWKYPSGDTVIVGHVAANGTPGPFLLLKELGVHNNIPDKVTLKLTDGTTKTYEFESSELITNPNDITVWQKVFGPRASGDQGLELVTCTGPVNNDGRHAFRLIDRLKEVE